MVAENWVAEMPRNGMEMRASRSMTAAAGKVSMEFMKLVMVMVQVLEFAQVGRLVRIHSFEKQMAFEMTALHLGSMLALINYF